MMLMRIDSSARAPFMFDENRIVDELTKQFGDRFGGLLKQHSFLWVVWRECLDRDLMLQMLWRSPYRQSYYPELCDLVRSLDDGRIASGRDPLDEVVACQKAVLEADYAKEIDREEIVAERLWKLVWHLVDIWTRDACEHAIGEAIYDRRYPKSESERDAYWISTQRSLMQEQAKQLRDLIGDPFLPNPAQVRVGSSELNT